MKYIIIHLGEVYPEYPVTKDHALKEAESHVRQQICDHYRHRLPINVSTDKDFDPDVKVFALSDEVELPLQEWADKYYQDMKDWDEKEEEREYKYYLKLKAKYETS